MKSALLEMLKTLPGTKVIEWMNESNFDDLIEIDVANDRCINIYHIPGKYYVPSLKGSYREIYTHALEHMIHPDDHALYREMMDPGTMLEMIAQSDTPGLAYFEVRYKVNDGSWRWAGKYLFAGERFGIREGIVRSYVFDIQNMKDRGLGGTLGEMRSDSRIRDEKTRLVREGVFLEEAARRISTRDVRGCCVAAIDLEHFRLFNDWYGRDTGDLLLSKVGETLAEIEGQNDALAGYFGQDDFCLLMHYNQQQITNLHKRLCAIFAEMGAAVGFRPMIGICKVEEGVPILDLIDRAKLALDIARRDIKVGVCLYESKMQEKTNREYEILLDFKTGLRDREFKVYLQPQCRISSGKVVGAEALARWRKSDGTVVSPADFIPVLEKYGFIADLDCYIWEEVCRQQRLWIDSGHEVIPVSVNVSQGDFYTIDVPEFLDELTKKYNVPKSLLKVEITESAFAESMNLIVNTTQRLRDKGFLVLMDDFGSGYSSLNMLNSLNVDVIKLDAGFFRMGDEDIRKGTRIVESIVSMAKNLSLPIITEGVETKEQVDFLDSLGCRFIQGFYYYRPMPVEDFEELVGTGAQIDERGFSFKANEQVRVREFFDESLYNDSMLNNILGAVSFCTWHDDVVDIVRFNEQMYEEVGAPDFESICANVQDRVAAVDRERFFDLFRKATSDLLNGASGTISFVRRTGQLVRFNLRMYYLDDKGDGKLFYVSVKDVTDLHESRMKSRVLAEYYPHSIVLCRWHGDGWRLIVAINGLGSALGLTQDEVQAEFDDGRFLQRLKPGAYEEADAAARAALAHQSGFELDVDVKANDGTFLPLHITADYVEDALDDVTHIMTISQNP